MKDDWLARTLPATRRLLRALSPARRKALRDACKYLDAVRKSEQEQLVRRDR